jgi:hypothetical protein
VARAVRNSVIRVIRGLVAVMALTGHSSAVAAEDAHLYAGGSVNLMTQSRSGDVPLGGTKRGSLVLGVTAPGCA